MKSLFLDTSFIIALELADERYHTQANQYWRELHNDKSYSLTDCISFLLMNRLNIQEALTFDQHFVQAGFQRVPM